MPLGRLWVNIFCHFLTFSTHDFAGPNSKTTSGLRIRQIVRKICFVQLN